jgi:hypothetical protein
MVAISDEWARLLYAYRFDKKLRLRDLTKAMAPHIAEWNRQHPGQELKTFSIKSLSKHFSKHVPTEVQLKYQMTNKSGLIHKLTPDREPIKVVTPEDTQLTIHKKSVAVFDELTDLFGKLKGLFEAYLSTHPTINPLSIHLEIIREMRKTLSEIAKLKQSKELVKIAVRSVIDTFLTKIVEDAGRSVDSLKVKLMNKCNDQVFVDGIVEEFKRTLVDAMIDAARMAIDRVKVEFALGDASNNED